MTQFTVTLSKVFAKEFLNFPSDQQLLISNFISQFQRTGIVFENAIFPGKFSPSWSGINITNVNYQFAYNNHLWHYHIGIPEYITPVKHNKYKVSDWVLHFQWIDKGNTIHLVDLYSHHTSQNEFYLPPSYRLM